jgi:hypothetical protein
MKYDPGQELNQVCSGELDWSNGSAAILVDLVLAKMTSPESLKESGRNLADIIRD